MQRIQTRTLTDSNSDPDLLQINAELKNILYDKFETDARKGTM